ncbi:enterotoxin A family protein [Paraburkholderia rhizosphaerae]|uniref:enterotoxin A family protein n=1 Tax=Paraburkholderia rhizosphaerae TaxID=480658 RepID=UPI001416F619|nr:enterotoxin A family protein [Paraburkholderia rhizosphaerae]
MRSTAWSYYPFDQADYSDRTGPNGICQGWVRSALSRLDNPETVDLTDAVRRMRADINHRGSFVSGDTITRARNLQRSADGLQLHHYAPARSAQMNGTRGSRINRFFELARQNLSVGDVAHFALGLNPRGKNTGTKGHVMLLQRLPQSRYALFDPNNGALTYSSRRDMEAGLRRYMDEAFADTGMQLTPDAVQFYAHSEQANDVHSPQGPHDAPNLPPTRPEAPLTASAQPESPTRDALGLRADQANSVSIDTLSGAAGEPNAMSGLNRGLATVALRGVAQGPASNLTDATEAIRQRLADPAQRPMTLSEIGDMQQQNGAGVVEPLPGYARRRGSDGILSAANLIADLRQHFDSLHVTGDTSVGYATDLAVINLSMRERSAQDRGAPQTRADGVPIVVQRLRELDDFRGDRYELYEPGSGVYRYDNFEEMANALRGVFDVGFRALGGVDHADTTYYANLSMPMGAAGGAAAPAARPSIGNLDLGQIEQRLGIIGAHPGLTPRPGLAPPPVRIEPRHDLRDLKRWAMSPMVLKPDGLFRPSTVSPAQLKAQGGFDSERTPVSDINLSVHNMDVASNPHLIDSAGYLGTFREEKTALSRLPEQSADGYIYFVAPTPNMVDVMGSLGYQAHAPWNGEVAAMGWIDYPQIRGWRVVKNGVAGEYVSNPDYRWDVYDQTRIAGAQPQLARLPVNDGIWREDGYRAYVSDNKKSGGSVKFNEDPNLTHALFYDAAWEKVRELNNRQAAGLDYRGALRLHAYGSSDTSNTQIYIDPRGKVQVNTMYSSYSTANGTRHDLMFGDDGRFHLIGDEKKVLRVGSDGYVYLGAVPDDPASLNGVFEYNGKNLVHQEDQKYLTTGLSVFTPFIDDQLHGERSEWHLRSPDGKDVNTPVVNQHTFRNMTAGSAQHLHAFYQDPDVALPRDAARFVTQVPGNAYRGNFLGYVNQITAEDARDTANWLRKQNAAWLFNDGFYAVANGPDAMEVRRLDGIPVWRAEGVSVEPANVSEVKFVPLLPLSSNYRIRNETAERVDAREARRNRVLAVLNQLSPGASDSQ